MFSDKVLETERLRRERGLERSAKWFRNLTPEQLDRKRARNREHMRRRARGESKPRKLLSLEEGCVKRREVRARQVQRAREFANEYKREHPCVDCGFSDIRALQFDHRDPAEKRMHVSELVKRGAATRTLMVEIAKCDVRCANCHFIRSAEESHHLVGRRHERTWTPSAELPETL